MPETEVLTITQPYPPQPWPPTVMVTWDQNSFPGADTSSFDIGPTGDVCKEVDANSLAAELNATKLFPCPIAVQTYVWMENVYNGSPADGYDFYYLTVAIPGVPAMAQPSLGFAGQLISARKRPGTHWMKDAPAGPWALLWA